MSGAFPAAAESFEDPTAAGYCSFRIQTEAAVAGGCEDLHRAVQKIADENRPVGLAF